MEGRDESKAKLRLLVMTREVMGATNTHILAVEGAKALLVTCLMSRERIAEKLGSRADYVHLDVTKPTDWAQAVTVAEGKFGPVNIL